VGYATLSRSFGRGWKIMASDSGEAKKVGWPVENIKKRSGVRKDAYGGLGGITIPPKEKGGDKSTKSGTCQVNRA